MFRGEQKFAFARRPGGMYPMFSWMACKFAVGIFLAVFTRSLRDTCDAYRDRRDVKYYY